MKWVKGFLYLIILCLFLEVIKTVISKQQINSSYFIATICISLQFLFFTGYFIFLGFSVLFKRFSFKKKGLLSFWATLGAFFLLEVYCSWMLSHSQHIPSFLGKSVKYYYDYYNCPLIQYEENASSYDPQLFYTLKPNARFRYFNREFDNAFAINSKGVRDDEKSLASPEIICLGDSYAMGWGVDQEETFAQYLEKLSGMKTLNAAVSSYGTAREMIQLKRLDTAALKYLIIQYCYNDYPENLNYISGKYELPISDQSVYDSVVARQNFQKKYFPGKYGSLIGQVFLRKTINKITPIFPLVVERERPFGDEGGQAEAFVKILYNSPQIDFSKVRVIVTVLDSYEHLNNSFLKKVELIASQAPYKDHFAGNLQTLNMSGNLQVNDFYNLDLHIRASGHKKVAHKIWQMINTE
jgi:hypothetical protein